MKYVIVFIISFWAAISLHGQTAELWTLQQCITFAEQNNIAIKKAEVQRINQEISLQTAQLSMLPNLNASAGQNFSFGRATGSDNVIVNQSMAATNLNLQASMPLFNGLRIYHQIGAGKLNLQAATEDLNSAKEDLALNIMGLYLQILFNKELLTIAQEQVLLSKEQLVRTEQLVLTGKLSEAELYENRAQLAVAEQNITTANNNLQLALLDLCQVINYQDVASFDVASIDVDILTLATSLITPSEAYNYSLGHRPNILASQARVESSLKEVRIAQSQYYPQLNLSGSYSTGYNYFYNSNNQPFGSQLSNNSQELIALSLSIPIFNRLSVRNSVKQARLNTELQDLTLNNTKQELFKQIQTAYYNATAAHDKYNAAKKTAEASRIAFSYEQKKYESGRATAYEYSSSKTRYQKALSEEAQAKYDYLFSVKIFEFYSGKPIDL